MNEKITREQRYSETVELTKLFKKELINKELKVKLDILMNQALIIIQTMAPRRKGILAGSFKIEVIEDGVVISTNIEYMPYTEEKWISPRWRGRQNPNENWLKETTEYVARYIALGLGGRYVSN